MSTESQDQSTPPSNTQVHVQAEPEVQHMAPPAPAPAASSAVPPANVPGKSVSLLLVVAVSLLSSVVSVAAYDHFFAQKVVAVDIKSFIEERKAEYVAGRLDDAGIKREMDKLEATVAAIPKNKAVLMGDLVVKNVPVIKP